MFRPASHLAALAAAWLLVVSPTAWAGDLIVQLAKGMKAASAAATAPGPDLSIDGQIEPGQVRFQKLPADTAYDVRIVLANEMILQGVNMSWYNEEAAKADAGDFTDDDRKEIQAILEVPSFYNRSEIVLLNADHDRAVVLQQLIRDTAFHSSKDGEVIWRMELGYFKNQYGGWAKLNQVSKVLRRERFANHQAYEHAVANLKWLPALGGISVGKDQTMTVALPAGAPATTRPSGHAGN